METAELRSRFASSAVARLATVRPDGAPHVLPVVFALVTLAIPIVMQGLLPRPHRLRARLLARRPS